MEPWKREEAIRMLFLIWLELCQKVHVLHRSCNDMRAKVGGMWLCLLLPHLAPSPVWLPSTGAAAGLKYHREVGRAGGRRPFIVIAVTGKRHPYSSGHRPEGHPWLSPAPKIQSINNSFWLYLQNTPRIQRSRHLRCSHPSPSQHITHLYYVNAILSGPMTSPSSPSVHTGARVTRIRF